MKNYQYTIYRKNRYLLPIFIFAITLIILPLTVGIVLSLPQICAFSICGFILLIYFAYEFFYLRKCKILITNKDVRITKPFFNHSFSSLNVYWCAKAIGLRGGYRIFIKQDTKTLIGFDLDWENFEYITNLKSVNPLSAAEKEVIKIAHNSR